MESGTSDAAPAGSHAGDGGLDGSAAASPPRCAPAGGGPYWIEEGENVTAIVQCSLGPKLAGAAFTLTGLPPGAAYAPATATLTWTTGIDDAGVYKVLVTARDLGETGEIRIGVADNFHFPKNPIKDPTTYTEEYGLPVLHLQTTPEMDRNLMAEQADVRDKWSNAYYPCPAPPRLDAGATAPAPGDAGAEAGSPTGFCAAARFTPVTVVYRGKIYQAEGHYRGWSSLFYPPKKLNWALRFPGERFDEPVLAGGRLRARKRINLITTIDDNSYARWRLAFALWNRFEPDKGIHIESTSAVVYVDGEYRGLYTVSDKVDDDLMERHGLAPDGNLFMAIEHAGNLDQMVGDYDAMKLAPRICPYQGFEKKDGLPEQCAGGREILPAAFADLGRLHDFVAKSSDVTFRNQVAGVLDIDDFTTWFVVATAIEANDSYAKNGYFYHDTNEWRLVLWDYNASFGQDYETYRSRAMPAPATDNPWPDPRYFVARPTTLENYWASNVWRRLWNDSVEGPRLRQAYGSAIRGKLSAEVALGALDEIVKEIGAAARRDEQKFGGEYRAFFKKKKRTMPGPNDPPALPIDRFLTFTEEVDYIRQWIKDRWAYLASIFPG